MPQDPDKHYVAILFKNGVATLLPKKHLEDYLRDVIDDVIDQQDVIFQLEDEHGQA